MILLVNPITGDVASIRWGDDQKVAVFTDLVLAGWKPVGPQCQAAAERILARQPVKTEG